MLDNYLYFSPCYSWYGRISILNFSIQREGLAGACWNNITQLVMGPHSEQFKYVLHNVLFYISDLIYE